MPFNRFYVEEALETGAHISIRETEFHHLAHVMRVLEGETIELVNGKGSLATALVLSIGKKKAELKIETAAHKASHPPQISLGLPFLRPSKLEWIVEKGTELGVDSFLFYPADLGEKKELSQNSLERLKTLMISAMKQSGRLFLPHLELLSSLPRLFEREGQILFGDTKNNLQKPQEFQFPLLFISGPEAGFSEKEQSLLEKKAVGTRLSQHILRAETAPIAAASLFAWKQLG